MHSWSMFNAYHAAYIGARGVMRYWESQCRFCQTASTFDRRVPSTEVTERDPTTQAETVAISGNIDREIYRGLKQREL